MSYGQSSYGPVPYVQSTADLIALSAVQLNSTTAASIAASAVSIISATIVAIAAAPVNSATTAAITASIAASNGVLSRQKDAGGVNCQTCAVGRTLVGVYFGGGNDVGTTPFTYNNGTFTFTKACVGTYQIFVSGTAPTVGTVVQLHTTGLLFGFQPPGTSATTVANQNFYLSTMTVAPHSVGGTRTWCLNVTGGSIIISPTLVASYTNVR